jgi:hypothetical protein
MGYEVFRRVEEDGETVLSIAAETELGGVDVYRDTVNTAINIRPDLIRGMYVSIEQKFPDESVHEALKLYVN